MATPVMVKTPRDTKNNLILFIDVQQGKIFADPVEHARKRSEGGLVHFYASNTCTIFFRPFQGKKNIFGCASKTLPACTEVALNVEVEDGAVEYGLDNTFAKVEMMTDVPKAPPVIFVP